MDLQKSSNFRREEDVGKRARSGLILCKHILILIRNLVKTAYGRITQLQRTPIAPLCELAGS